nr:TolC family protein [uncultured Duganella sp.]
MHVPMLPLVAALLAIPFAPCIGAPQTPHQAQAAGVIEEPNVSLTLDDAYQKAQQQNPDLQRLLAQTATAQGEAADAKGLLWNNPELALERTRRVVPQAGIPSDTQREWQAGITQTFEIAGQQGYRRKVTSLELEALSASISEARLKLRFDVERQFVEVLSLQFRVATEQSSLDTIEKTAQSISKRVNAGEDSRLDGNLAQVEAIRARNQIGLVQEQLLQARAELATILQITPGTSVEAIGTLETAPPLYTLEQLLALSASRPLINALDLREQAASARLSLERAARYPDVTVGVATSREGSYSARERLVRLTLSVPLPLFKHNGGAIGRASTELAQAQIERQSTRRDTASDIRALWQKLQSQAARVNALRSEALPALEENQRLSVKSLQAGEIGLTQLLLVNRQVLDGKRDLIDAETELRLTRIALDRAAGWSPGAQR